MRRGGRQLSRTEVRRVAGALGYLVERHGDRDRASEAAGFSRELFSRFSKLRAAETVLPSTLEAIARAAGCSVAELLAGRGPAGALPSSSSVLVRREARAR